MALDVVAKSTRDRQGLLYIESVFANWHNVIKRPKMVVIYVREQIAVTVLTLESSLPSKDDVAFAPSGALEDL
jgi:hypothetical protein